MSDSCTEEEDGNENEDLDEDEDDDFVCVPMSNIDKDTMTFKNSEKIKISLRGTDRMESGRKGDSAMQPYSSDRPGTSTQERY